MRLTSTTLAALYQAQGKHGEAERMYKQSLEVWEKSLGPNHPYVAKGMENYARLLRKLNREEEAAKFQARANAILIKYVHENLTE